MGWGWGLEGERKESKRSLRKPVKGKNDLKGSNTTRVRNSEETGVQYTAKFQQYEIVNTVKAMKFIIR